MLNEIVAKLNTAFSNKFGVALDEIVDKQNKDDHEMIDNIGTFIRNLSIDQGGRDKLSMHAKAIIGTALISSNVTTNEVSIALVILLLIISISTV